MSKKCIESISLSMVYAIYNGQNEVELFNKHIADDNISSAMEQTLNVTIVLSEEQLKVIRKVNSSKGTVIVTYQNFLSIIQNTSIKDTEYVSIIYDQLGNQMFPLLLSIPKSRSDCLGSTITEVLNRLALIVKDICATKLSISSKALIREITVLPCLAKMKRRGIRIDYDGLMNKLYDIKREINMSLDFIYNKLGVSYQSENFNQIFLNQIESSQVNYHEIELQMKNINRCKKILSNYDIDRLNSYIDINHYLRCQWNSFGTISGRITTTKPNLQGFPKQLRKFWIPADGYAHIWGDYVSEELILLAYLAKEDKLIESIQRGVDLHQATAATIFRCGYTEVTEQQRTVGKKVNFSILYGSGCEGLQKQLNDCGIRYSLEEISIIKNSFFDSYPAVKAFQRKLCISDKIQSVGGKVWNASRLPAKYKRLNMVIQSSGADILKEALIKLDIKLPKNWSLVFCIHDSILIEVPSCDAKDALSLLKESMQSAFKRLIPCADCVPVETEIYY